MSLISINHQPSRRQLHQFGGLWLLFLGILGALSFFKSGNHPAAFAFWTAAVTVPLIGWMFPSFMRIVFLALSYAAFPIGFVVSHVILALVFYLVLTPVGLLMRLFGHDPMERQIDSSAVTYWTEREDTAAARRYFNQF